MIQDDKLTADEWELLRQAARNQTADERGKAQAVECGECRVRHTEEARRRARVRESALRKIEVRDGLS